MTSFESLIKDIEKNRVLAKAEIPLDADPRTLTTRIGHKKRAIQNLEDLFFDYRTHVKDNSVLILPKGKQSKSFVDIAKEEFACFEISGDEIYEKIADGVDKRYYENMVSSPSLFDIFMGVFNDICDEIGITSYPIVSFESKFSTRLTSREDLVKLVKQAFNDKIGSELVGIYAIHKVSKQAIEDGYSGTTIPVVIHSSDNDLLDSLALTLKALSPNVFQVPATKKQDSKSVQDSLVKIKKSLK